MLELRAVCAGYGAKAILRQVSLTLPNGQITAVVGPNGCGKSTLLKLCAGQLVPNEGEVWADGLKIAAMPAEQIARKIAYMPQSRPVPDMTVESLALHGRFPWTSFPRVYRPSDWEIAEAAMEETGILSKRREMLSRISGGERQKAYLAMALAQQTEHILLDEPSAYLDIAVQMELVSIINNLRDKGKCIVIVLHDLAAAFEMADQIAVMKEGALLGVGAAETVLPSGAIEEAFGVRVAKSEQLRFLLK